MEVPDDVQARVRGVIERAYVKGGFTRQAAAAAAAQSVSLAVKYGVDIPDDELGIDTVTKVEDSAKDAESTERLMRYWAHGEGAAKIRWGEKDDFYRCEAHLGKYVASEQLKGLCANLHHRALGVWPGQEDHKAVDAELAKDEVPGLTAHSGMVSLDIEPGTIPGCQMNEPHITVAFLGDQVDDEMLSNVQDLAAKVAANTAGPLTGFVQGVDRFTPSEHSGGRSPIYTKPRVDGLRALHRQFKDVEHSSFGTYHPHVTLAYSNGALPEPVPHTPLRFDHLSVHRGGQVWHYPFQGADPKADGLRPVEKVGPHGYIHGWIFVGIPGIGDAVSHPASGHGAGVITGRDEEHHRITVHFANGHDHTFDYDPEPKGRTPGLVRTEGEDGLTHEHHGLDPVETDPVTATELRNAVTSESGANIDGNPRLSGKQFGRGLDISHTYENGRMVTRIGSTKITGDDERALSYTSASLDPNGNILVRHPFGDVKAISDDEIKSKLHDYLTEQARARRSPQWIKDLPGGPHVVTTDTAAEIIGHVADDYEATHPGVERDVIESARGSVQRSIQLGGYNTHDAAQVSRQLMPDAVAAAQSKKVSDAAAQAARQAAQEAIDRRIGPVTDTIGGVNLHLDGVRADQRDRLRAAVTDVTTHLPRLGKSWKTLRIGVGAETRSGNMSAYATAWQGSLMGGDARITLAPKYYGPKSKVDLDASTKAGFESGFHPTSGADSIVVHEMGHQVDYATGASSDPVWRDRSATARISAYATRNPAEAFAEAFELVQSHAWSPNSLPDPRMRASMQKAFDMLQEIKAALPAPATGEEPTCEGYIGEAARQELARQGVDVDEDDALTKFDPYELRGPNGEWVRGSAEADLRHSSEKVQQGAQHHAQRWFDHAGNNIGRVDKDPRALWSAYQDPDRYEAINGVLRGNVDVRNAPPRDELMRTVDGMFDQAGTTTDKPMVVWRALRTDGGTDWSKKMKVGSTFTDTGIVSTTAQGNLAEGWLGVGSDGSPDFHTEHGRPVMNVDPTDVVMEIHVPAGTRIVGGNDEFIETMLHPDSQFKITASYPVQSHPFDPLGGGKFPQFTYTRVVADMVKDGAQHGS